MTSRLDRRQFLLREAALREFCSLTDREDEPHHHATLDLIEEVNRLRLLILNGAFSPSFIDEFRDDDPSGWDALVAEAEAIRAEEQS